MIRACEKAWRNLRGVATLCELLPEVFWLLQVRVTRGRKASQSIVPRPEILKERRKPIPLPGQLPLVTAIGRGCCACSTRELRPSCLAAEPGTYVQGAKDTSASDAAVETYQPQQYPQQWLQQLQSFPAPKRRGMTAGAGVRKFSTCCSSGSNHAAALLQSVEFTAAGRFRSANSLSRSAGLSTFASRPFVI